MSELTNVAPTVIGATRADAIRIWNTRKAKTQHAERDGDTTREGEQ